MNPWINYHHLYYFKVIAEEGSVSKAATKLRLGQPTLSAQLMLFEKTLGVQLFERHHKKFVLTELGMVALDYAKNIFKAGSELLEVLHDRHRPQKHVLHLGALDSVPKHVIVQITRRALNDFSCQITLSEGRSDELLRELIAHRVDLMVTNFLPVGLSAKDLRFKLISREQVSIYGAPKFRALKKNFPRSISGVPLILPTYDSKMRQDLDHWGKLNQIELNTIVESQDIAVKKLMVVHELGLMPAAPHAVQTLIKQGKLVEIGQLDGIWEELYFISAQRKIENPVARALHDRFALKSVLPEPPALNIKGQK